MRSECKSDLEFIPRLSTVVSEELIRMRRAITTVYMWRCPQVNAETKALIPSAIVTLAFYLIFMNLPLQLPGNVQLPRFTNLIISVLIGVICYAVLLEVFQE